MNLHLRKHLGLAKDHSGPAQLLLNRILFGVAVPFVAIQFLLGSPMLACALGAALFLGLAAASASRWHLTIAGVLCLSHVIKTLYCAFVIKGVFWESILANLGAPTQTAVSMLLGYGGLFVGSLVFWRIFKARKGILHEPDSPLYYLILAVVVFLVGYGGWFLGFIIGGNEFSGIFGQARFISKFKEFSITAAIFYYHKQGARRIILQPVTLAMILAALFLGIFSITKQEMLNPIFYAVITVLYIRGISYKPIWISVAAGALLLQFFIYPYSQQVRFRVLSATSFRERVSIAYDSFWDTLTNPTVRRDLALDTEDFMARRGLSYFEADVGAFARVAMVSEASWLIEATHSSGEFTGWSTIKWGFAMLVPRALYPAKPVMSAANYLGKYAGVVGEKDDVTNISFGYIANFYNAFGYYGVLLGGVLFPTALFLWFGVFVGGNGSKLWLIFLVGNLHHTFVEAAFSGAIIAVFLPLYAYAFSAVAYTGSRLLK